MVRAGAAKFPKAFIFRNAGRRCMSKITGTKDHQKLQQRSAHIVEDDYLQQQHDEYNIYESSPVGVCWVPHPRTGIYYPEGHDWVMEGVPDGAASFPQTFWFRSVEGVDHKPADSHN